MNRHTFTPQFRDFLGAGKYDNALSSEMSKVERSHEMCRVDHGSVL